MKHLGLLVLAILAVFVVEAVSVTAADAAPPELLLLAGKLSELKAEPKGGEVVVETVGAKTLTASSVVCNLASFTRSPVELEKDANSAIAHCDFSGLKKGAVACRSETSGGTKDPVEIMLAFLSMHLAATDTAGKVLEPLWVVSVLGIESEAGGVTIVCGPIKAKIKGKLGCLMLPGLKPIAANAPIEFLCTRTIPGQQSFGTCLVEAEWCEKLTSEPFEAILEGVAEKAALEMHLEVKFEKAIFIDD